MKSKRSKVILAGTGHRPSKLGDNAYERRSPIQDWVRREVRKVFKRLKPDVVISGMALGFDQWLALEAISCAIPLHAYVPFEGQESRWWGESRTLYAELLSKAALVRTISSPDYEPWKMQKRNEAMVDDCTVVLSCWDGSTGGTWNCIAYANGIGRERININPVVGQQFIERKENEMRALSRGGGSYSYLGSLKWKFKPSVEVESPLVPYDESDIPF